MNDATLLKSERQLPSGDRPGLSALPGLMPFRNLNRSLSVESTRVVLAAMIYEVEELFPILVAYHEGRKEIYGHMLLTESAPPGLH